MLQYHLFLANALQSKKRVLHRRLYIMQRMHLLHHRSQSKMDLSLHHHKDKKTIPLIVKRNALQCRKLLHRWQSNKMRQLFRWTRMRRSPEQLYLKTKESTFTSTWKCCGELQWNSVTWCNTLQSPLSSLLTAENWAFAYRNVSHTLYSEFFRETLNQTKPKNTYSWVTDYTWMCCCCCRYHCFWKHLRWKNRLCSNRILIRDLCWVVWFQSSYSGQKWGYLYIMYKVVVHLFIYGIFCEIGVHNLYVQLQCPGFKKKSI